MSINPLSPRVEERNLLQLDEKSSVLLLLSWVIGVQSMSFPVNTGLLFLYLEFPFFVVFAVIAAYSAYLTLRLRAMSQNMFTLQEISYDITRKKYYIYIISFSILGIYAFSLTYQLNVLSDLVLLYIENSWYQRGLEYPSI